MSSALCYLHLEAIDGAAADLLAKRAIRLRWLDTYVDDRKLIDVLNALAAISSLRCLRLRQRGAISDALLQAASPLPQVRHFDLVLQGRPPANLPRVAELTAVNV